MKKHWLRGVLLGVSLALLLAGGVALAAGSWVTKNKGCVECWPVEIGPPEALIIAPDKYVVTLTYGGFVANPGYLVCTRQVPPNMPPYPWVCLPTPLSDPQIMPWWRPCELNNNPSELPLLPEGVDPSDGIESLYGRWAFEVEQRLGSTPLDRARVSWLFQGCCEEFVPEPGTIVLLGSGLAGLAGYATLRLRSRQALRSRTRE